MEVENGMGDKTFLVTYLKPYKERDSTYSEVLVRTEQNSKK